MMKPQNYPHTPVHVFECLLGLLGGLKLHISTAPVQVRVESVHWHVDSFDCPISRKDFLDMFLLNKDIAVNIKTFVF